VFSQKDFPLNHRSSFGLWAVVTASLLAAVATPAKEPKIGAPAPDFVATTVDGEKLTLADLHGQVIVINFWATWCGPCKRELPMLDAYYRAAKDKGLRVLAVTTENSLPLSQLKPLARVLAIPMVKALKGDYRVLAGVPTNYIIDRQGILRYARAEALDADSLISLLNPLLEEQPAASAARAATSPGVLGH